MRTIPLLILDLPLSAAVCHGQDDQEAPSAEGRNKEQDPATAPLDFDLNGVHPLSSPPAVPDGSSAIAEVITPEIAALARGLENDPQRIFDYVHDHIRYVHYFGSHKGAELTLLERSGNDFDQCALLVSLLRAAGFTNSVNNQIGKSTR